MGRKIVLGAVAVAGTAAFVFLVVVMVRQGLDRAGVWAAPLAALAGIIAAVAAVAGPLPMPSKVPMPPELEVPDWVVGRPTELAAVVAALVAGGAGTVGITTGLSGAGGFGKTTLARMVCADRRVRRHFGGRVYLVTMGRDVWGSAVAAKVNQVIKLVFDKDATFTDPRLAGQHLGSLLDAGPRMLLVLDDVWEPEQLAPFTEGGKKCARLVTTRVPELLAGRGTAVRVDQMSDEQARALLTGGLPPLDEAVVAGLLAVTGRWPLLLRLVSKILADYARVAPDVSAKGAVLVERLRAAGPAVVDDLLGEADRGLDVGQPDERARAVRATIGASTSLLDHRDAERFAELGVFAEDESVPFHLVAQLWRATAGLDDLQAAQVCTRLAQLALISQATAQAGGLSLHDVVRDFLRAEIGRQRLDELNGMLLDAVAADLPVAEPLDAAAGRMVRAAWWELDLKDPYLWDHLIEHLRNAERIGEADAVAGDLRWVGARLERFGPAAPAADLAAAGTPRAVRLRAVLARVAHLLAPTEPTGAVVDVLHSRVADDPDWETQVAALRDKYPRPRLVNRWPLPDLALADPALRRVLTGHGYAVRAVAVAPDGSWLVSTGQDQTVRIWDVATGRERATLTGHTGLAVAVTVAPDGDWLAVGSVDGTVRIWDVATWGERATLTGHTGWVEAVAVAPDGSWLVSASQDGTVRIWDVATWSERAILAGHTDWVEAVAVAPDGSWLATGSRDQTVRIWDVATGRERATLTGHIGLVEAVAVAPDGSWLATGGGLDGTVRIWDVATWSKRATLTGHIGGVEAVAVAPDGTWLATGGEDGTVRIWDVATEQEVWEVGIASERAILTGHTHFVEAVAVAPDGTWLATGSQDGTVRIWEMATEQEVWEVAEAHERAMDADTHRVSAMAAAPDCTWLATGGWDGAVRIWDAATGMEQAIWDGHTNWVSAMAVAPDGTWLATGGQEEGTVRIWDVATWMEQATLTCHPDGVEAIAVAPDGTWLATGGQEEGTVRIWDVATWMEQATLTCHPDGVEAIAVAPDGTWLATGGQEEGTVRIWDVATWMEQATLTCHPDGVEAIAVAPDGTWLATGGWDQAVRIWDVATWSERATLTSHPDRVTMVAVAPDGTWLATGDAKGTVQIWEVATGRARALMRIDGSVNASAWLGANALAVGGSTGLYLFDFLTDVSSVAAA